MTRTRILHLAALLTAFTACLAISVPGYAETPPPVIAAASDLKFALEEVGAAFRVDGGGDIRFSFGSSGILSTQLRNGAPFQLFLSADEDYVSQLYMDGVTRDRGTLYAVGRLAIIVPLDSPLQPDSELRGLAAYLKEGKLKRFAIANPEHAPYGKRAVEALRRAGLWNGVESKLVLGENVSQAAQFAVDGAADGGIVSLSLAVSPTMSGQARYAVLPQDWYTPLRQRMVLMKNAGPTAQAFYGYLQKPAARAIMRRYGFSLPDETP